MILLDTHVVLWLAFAPEKISKRSKAAIDAARRNADALAISGISLLELATLARKGRIRLSISVENFLVEVESRFVVLPISARICAQAMALPRTFLPDPADRIICGTALVEGVPLISADRQIRRSRTVRVLW
ncbi:MAG: type II toxin-antitoxin system VapC family toxin [Candidatus Acidiferrales bacterium]